MAQLATGTRLSLGAAAAMTVTAVALSACNPLDGIRLDYGCHRQGSHGVVVCIDTNHNPSAAPAVGLPSSWTGQITL